MAFKLLAMAERRSTPNHSIGAILASISLAGLVLKNPGAHAVLVSMSLLLAASGFYLLRV